LPFDVWDAVTKGVLNTLNTFLKPVTVGVPVSSQYQSGFDHLVIAYAHDLGFEAEKIENGDGWWRFRKEGKKWWIKAPLVEAIYHMEQEKAHG